jgi:RNA polymerase sigma-70 factor (ECF subfamily)
VVLDFLVKFAANLPEENGSRDTFDKHLLPHAAVIYRSAFRLCGSAQGSEDLVQETYYIALKNFGQLKDRAKSKYWLFAILRNLFLKDIEKSKNRIEIEFEAVCDRLHNSSHPENEYLKDEVKRYIQAALNKLDERLREPIRLFYFEGLSYQEISKRLNIPIGTVMSRIARAKVSLKRDLVRSGSSSIPQEENSNKIW